MSFGQAIASAFRRYIDFSGRSSRSEYWYFYLLYLIGIICLGFLDSALFPGNKWQPLSLAFALVLMLPSLALGARRLHDINRTGWWLLLWILPFIGMIIIIIWACRKGDDGENRFGTDPLSVISEEMPPSSTA
jgi:uncharacterized membrane protein YhaH (DUF805 family)